ncbi:hypothetical protein U27_03262 [Candidatus Vecturithrix granuli]|uniref:Uncharacterized protein n=1 Tax=Vecturithrix granuli TaxID=1499967 RepID=A0A081BVE5_VECG1|nr:hypothetical protein U27_03262 [Candidatus Vecturithrix granuli]
MTSEPNRQHRKNQPVRALLLFSQPTVFALMMAVILMQWRVATVVQVDMIAACPECCFNETVLRARVASGEFFPTNVRQINIRYPEYPEIKEKMTTVAGKFMFAALDRIVIRSFACDAACQEIRIVLKGKANQAYLTQENQLYEDYRLTMFDKVRHSSIARGSGVILWILLTALGWVKVYRELKRQD